MSIIKQALDFAKERHHNQYRKYTGLPAITHASDVSLMVLDALILSEGTLNIKPVIAALLHDVVEDTYVGRFEIGFNIIGHKFGQRVRKIVDELTIREEELEKVGKKEYLAERINNISNDALLVRLCDMLNNVEGLCNMLIPIHFTKSYIENAEYVINNLERNLTLEQSFIFSSLAAQIKFIKSSKLEIYE